MTKKEIRIYKAKWRAKNRERIREYQRKWVKKNKKKQRQLLYG